MAVFLWFPLLYGRAVAKNFTLKIEDIYDTIKPVYHIAFTPTGARQQGFSGEVWIDKKAAACLNSSCKTIRLESTLCTTFSDGK